MIPRTGASAWIWLSAAIIVLDQIIKAVAADVLSLHQPVRVMAGVNLTLMHNTGAAFSLLNEAGGWQRWLFTVLAVGVSTVIVVWLARLPPQRRWLACALALILGGALGNLWDRLVLGYVIDFVDLYYKTYHWPAFNLADSAITVGALMFILDGFRRTADGGRG